MNPTGTLAANGARLEVQAPDGTWHDITPVFRATLAPLPIASPRRPMREPDPFARRRPR